MICCVDTTLLVFVEKNLIRTSEILEDLFFQLWFVVGLCATERQNEHMRWVVIANGRYHKSAVRLNLLTSQKLSSGTGEEERGAQ